MFLTDSYGFTRFRIRHQFPRGLGKLWTDCGLLSEYSPFIDPICGAFSVRAIVPPEVVVTRCCDHRLLEECGLAVRSGIGQSWRSFASRTFDLTEQRATRDASCAQTSPQCISFRFHLDLHFMGELSGQVRLDWLQQQGYGVCSVCNRVLSSHFDGLHPRCYGAFTAAAAPAPLPVGRPLIDGAPSLSDVSTSCDRLRTSILTGARDIWSKCLIHALASVVAHRDERSWVDLLNHACSDSRRTLTRLSSPRPPRQAITVSRRCQDWLDGLHTELWEPSSQPASHRQQDPGSDFRLSTHISNRVAALIQDGALRRACTAVTQVPPVQATSSVIDELRVLHPRPRPQDSALLSGLRDIGPAAVLCVSPDMIRKAVSDFSPTSSALPQLPPASHCGWLLAISSSVCSMRSYSFSCKATFLPPLSHGFAGPHAWRWGSLRVPSGLSRSAKPSAGSRAKSHSSLRGGRSKMCSSPFRLGVRTCHGTGGIVHAARQWMNRHSNNSNKVMVLIDIKNAFNCVDRSAVLQAVRESFSEIVPWADLCYRSPSSLVIGDSTIDSSRGVQQGDPLGPALFALAIHPVIPKACCLTLSAFPGSVDLSPFFLDDGVLAGDAPAISSFLRHLIAGFVSIGLEIALHKTE